MSKSTLDAVAEITGSLKQAQTLIDELRARGLIIVRHGKCKCEDTHVSAKENIDAFASITRGFLDD